MSIQQKLFGVCDAALLVIVGVLQIGIWVAIADASPDHVRLSIAHQSPAKAGSAT